LPRRGGEVPEKHQKHSDSEERTLRHVGLASWTES